jgi:hypothetical protein
MLHARSLPQRLWMKKLIVQHTSKIYLPIDLSRSSVKPEVTHFRIFSSCAWAQTPSEKRKALDPQRTECIFFGYLNNVKGYRIIDISLDHPIIEHSFQ